VGRLEAADLRAVKLWAVSIMDENCGAHGEDEDEDEDGNDEEDDDEGNDDSNKCDCDCLEGRELK
jgi:hypothetical protein